MIVKIMVDDDESEQPIGMTFNNEQLNNYNFVDMNVNGYYVTIGVEDLYRVAKLFNEIRNENKDY